MLMTLMTAGNHENIFCSYFKCLKYMQRLSKWNRYSSEALFDLDTIYNGIMFA